MATQKGKGASLGRLEQLHKVFYGIDVAVASSRRIVPSVKAVDQEVAQWSHRFYTAGTAEDNVSGSAMAAGLVAATFAFAQNIRGKGR